MVVQCEYVKLMLLNNIHTTVSGCNEPVHLTKTLMVKEKHVMWTLKCISNVHYGLLNSDTVNHTEQLWHLVFLWNESHLNHNENFYLPSLSFFFLFLCPSFPTLWAHASLLRRCSNMCCIHVDTRGKQHKGGQPTSWDRHSAHECSSRLTQTQESHYFHTGNLIKYKTCSS